MCLITKTIFAFICCLVLTVKITAQSPSTAQPKLKLGYVKNGDLDCGEAYAYTLKDLRNRRFIFAEGMDEPASINVNGNNIKLHPVDSSEGKGKEKIGRRSWKTYTAGYLKVRLDKVVTKICDPTDESCEVIYYKVVMTVTRKSQKIIVKLTGFEGC